MLAHLYGVENKHSGGAPILSDAALTGVSGVDLFFVISGFIMVWIAGNLEPGLRTSGKFMFARVMRIYPVWWLFAGAMSVYLFISYGAPWDAEALEQLSMDGWSHWINSMLLIPHEALPVLQVGWTLIHEMYFYLVFAALLLLPAAFRVPALIFWAIVILGSISLQLTGFYANSFFSLIFFPMTLEFLFGAAAAYALQASAGRFRWSALILGTAWLGVAVMSVDFTQALASAPTHRTLTYGPAFALLVYAAVAFEQRARLGNFIPHWLVRIGDWSYSLYLCHLLVISAVARLFYPRFASAGMFDNLIFLAIAASAALVVSAFAFYLFERPVLSISRTARNKWFGQTNSQRDRLQVPNSPDISESSQGS